MLSMAIIRNISLSSSSSSSQRNISKCFSCSLNNPSRRQLPPDSVLVSDTAGPSYNNLVFQAAKLIGPPATFDASKLEVIFKGEEKDQYTRIIPRTYNLSHCDFTADLTLTISNVIDHDQLKGWYNKDDVVAQWAEVKGHMCLDVHCYVSGPNSLLDIAAEFRYYIFSKELPLVLSAVLYGDRLLFSEHKELMDAFVRVFFHSSIRKYNRVECWGPLKDAAKVDANANGNADEKDGVTSPKVTIPRISRTASTGFLPSSLPKSTSQRRSQTPGRIRPVNSLLRSFSRKSMDSNSFNGAPTLSRRNSSTIVYSNANGLQKPPDMVKRLECTLEELCFGCIKKVNIKRDVLTSDGQIIQEDEVLTINVKPGWKKGTKITFEGMGNENPGNYAADITFVIDEKIHPIFKRNGDDLEVSAELPLVDALTGCTFTIRFLDGHESCLIIDDIITPGYTKTIEGQGMTLLREEETRGNLNIKFSVRFPHHLTEEQQRECFNILQNSC